MLSVVADETVFLNDTLAHPSLDGKLVGVAAYGPKVLSLSNPHSTPPPRAPDDHPPTTTTSPPRPTRASLRPHAS